MQTVYQKFKTGISNLIVELNGFILKFKILENHDLVILLIAKFISRKKDLVGKPEGAVQEVCA